MESNENLRITLPDLLAVTEDQEVTWRKVPPSKAIPKPTYRTLYLGRLYILYASGKLSVYNSRNDGQIWSSPDAIKLLNLIKSINHDTL